MRGCAVIAAVFDYIRDLRMELRRLSSFSALAYTRRASSQSTSRVSELPNHNCEKESNDGSIVISLGIFSSQALW